MKFTELKLIDELQQSLAKKGYTDATPIQTQAIPHLLAGKDVMGVAQTGTGKTAAFGLPVLQLIAEHPKVMKPYHVRVLILAPTRELAAQIDKALQTYGKGLRFNHACIFGGVNQRPQEKALSKGVDVLVATPGRLLDLYRQKIVFLKDVEYFVLDEADRMLDMGFQKDMEAIIAATGSVKQKLLFSATMAPAIEKLARTMLRNPVHVEIEPESTTVDTVDQFVMYVNGDDKNDLLLHLLAKDELDHVIVFTRTKRKADRLERLLQKKGHSAEAIHGDKSQNQRTRTLNNFRNKKTSVLVATEVAARGLDVNDITHVINLDVPHDPESYVHRIGRTGRAGNEGVAFLFCDAQERSLVKDIEKAISQKIPVQDHKFHSQKAQESNQKYKHPGRGSYGRKSKGRGRGGSKGGKSSGGKKPYNRSSPKSHGKRRGKQ